MEMELKPKQILECEICGNSFIIENENHVKKLKEIIAKYDTICCKICRIKSDYFLEYDNNN